MACQSRKPIPQITPLELRIRMDGGTPPFLLDVRERYEWEIGNLAGAGAVLIPYTEVGRRLDELPLDRPIVVYCHVGVRSALIVQDLMSQGFTDVSNLKGGYLAWADEVDPDLPRY